MKIYDLVHNLLLEREELRSSDKKLIWSVYDKIGLIEDDSIRFVDFMDYAPSPESITRARRKIQELHTELQGNEEVEKARYDKEKQKGTFVFREEVNTC